MSSSQRVRILAAVVAVTVVLGGISLGAYWLGTGTGSRQSAEPTSSTTSPATTSSALSAACRKLARTWLASDTRTDPGPNAARQRAAEQYGTVALQQRVAGRPQQSPSQRWQRWTAHEARIDTHLTPYTGEKPPPGSAEHSYAAVTVARTAHGRDGWSAPLPAVTVYCTLERQLEQGWRIDEVSTSLHQGQR